MFAVAVTDQLIVKWNEILYVIDTSDALHSDPLISVPGMTNSQSTASAARITVI
jgi:hypothetical protein